MAWMVLAFAALCAADAPVSKLEVSNPAGYEVGDLPVHLRIEALGPDGKRAEGFCGTAKVDGLLQVQGRDRIPLTQTPPFENGLVELNKVVLEDSAMDVTHGEARGGWSPERHIPGFFSILPPLFAILLALIFRQALIALFAGVWMGALFVHGYHPFTALLRSFDTYLPATIASNSSASILLFTMALGGMVGIISASGASNALVDIIAKRAHSRRAGMLTAWAAGIVVFFDDYANCLLVGNTVRPFTDRLRVSREKLAYIVDSTAAPVTTIALVSTWIGYQAGLFDNVDELGKGHGYSHFLSALPYSFYSFFTIFFVFLIAWSRRDFGPMLEAERRAFHDGHLVRPGGQPLMDRELTEMAENSRREGAHWLGAAVPVASVILITIIGLYMSGSSSPDLPDGAGLREIFASADSYAVLLWASFGGCIIAATISLIRRDLTFNQTMESWIAGVKSMVMAALILVLAWALGAMCKDSLLTGDWVISTVSPSPHFLPVITFTVSAIIALATGSSFSTMAIVIPIAAPMAWQLTGDAGLSPHVIESIRYATLAAVLSGSVFGDHCSPISDTTIMSSMASASDHVDHVRTQMPYALFCAGTAGIVGFLPAGWGISPLITVPIGILVCVAAVYGMGRPVEAPPVVR